MAAGKILLHGCACLCAFLGAPSSLTAQSAAPSTVFRDPRAVAIAQQVIAASGGSEAWRAIHSISTHWTYTASEASGSTTLTCNDDWDSGSMVFVHSTGVGTAGSSISATAAKVVTAQTPGSTPESLAATAQLNYLPLYAPAAALQLELTNSSYAFEYRGKDRSNIRLRTEKITPNGSLDLSTVQDWLIDPSSSQPVQVTYRDLGMKTGHLVEDVLRFSGYSTEGAVTVPTQLYLSSTDFPALKLNAFSAE